MDVESLKCCTRCIVSNFQLLGSANASEKVESKINLLGSADASEKD
jgi:hypothetical protein